MSEDRLALFISSPKGYKDIFDVFIKCYRYFWANPKYPIYLSTNYDAKYEGVHVISSGVEDDTWVERTNPALQSINAKYVMLLCDDLFICDYIKESEVEKVLDIMDEENIDFCRLKPLKKGKRVKGSNNLCWVNKQIPYGLNLQRGIYNKNYLSKLLGDGAYSAWEIEGKWLKESMLAKNEYFSNVISCDREIIPVIHGVEKGKWIPYSLDKLEKMGIVVIPKRSVMTRKYALQESLKTLLSNMLHPKLRLLVKLVLKRIGVNFTSEY